MAGKSHALLWFQDVDKHDTPLVGVKGTTLGEMAHAGFPLPPGFILSSKAYFQFVRENKLAVKIEQQISTINFDQPESVHQVSNHIKRLFMHEEMSPEVVKDIADAYHKIGGLFKNAIVTAQSCATTENALLSPFIGQQETLQNIQGEANLIVTIRELWASLFLPQALIFRHQQHIDHFRIGVAVIVQKMIEPESSGIMLTVEPVTNNKATIIIEAIFGHAQLLSKGQVTPDHYEVSKKDLDITNKVIATQEVLMQKVNDKHKELKLSKREGSKQKLSHNQILEIAMIGKRLEQHYYFPQGVEWALEKKKIYIIQTFSITHPTTGKVKEEKLPSQRLQLLLKGAPASPGLVSGPVRIITTIADLAKIRHGDIMVSSQTTPDYVPGMKKAAAIITDKGGWTSHAATVSRELGIPAVIGATNATAELHAGTIVTVNGSKGEVYKGAPNISANTKAYAHHDNLNTATKVYVNLAQPSLAEKTAKGHVDGIGLLRAEFIMADIGVHPKKMLQLGKRHEYIQQLAEKIEVFCSAFNPRPVVYRTSDLKTDEYREMEGGKDFEPHESNPSLGYRGSFRYINEPKTFEMELEAIKLVREKKGLKNLWVMIPYIRSVHELVEVKRMMQGKGLHRSPSFKLWMAVETPANIVMLDKYIEAGIDGITVGTNDLTMLMLGTDRDNTEVSSAFNELDPAVLWAIEHAIKTAHKHGVTSSICGQAPSVYPQLLEKLVTWGVTSVSIAPDAIDAVREKISETERRLVIEGKKR